MIRKSLRKKFACEISARTLSGCLCRRQRCSCKHTDMCMAQPPRSVTLLARSQARSDDAEVDSLEQPLVAPAVHPFTGTFAASEHTVEFGSKAFRTAFPLHVLALALLLFVLCVCATSRTEYLFILLPLGLLVLGARIAMHRWNCRARAQRFGAIAWTITVACGCTSDFITYCLDPKALCKSAGDLYTYPMTSILLAIRIARRTVTRLITLARMAFSMNTRRRRLSLTSRPIVGPWTSTSSASSVRVT